MKPAPCIRIGFALAFALFQAQAEEEFRFTNLPPGFVLVESKEVPHAQTASIGAKLGGKLVSLTNNVLSVHGANIQINILQAATPGDAEKLHGSIAAMKGHPAFCVRRGNVVAEFVSSNPDPAVALKASWELGLAPKPAKVHYRVTAALAPVKAGSAEAANQLFNLLILASRGQPRQAEIDELKAGITFGNELRFRDGVSPRFEPAASAQRGGVYTFADLTDHFGVPAVRITLELTTPEVSAPSEPGQTCLQATETWPVKDPLVQELAAKVSKGKASPEAKVQAILEWLTPGGGNMRYGGPQGSRLGTKTALNERSGRCWDFSDIFVTVARAAGVPARQVAGWLYGVSGHVWAEYHDGTRWVQVDPTGGGKLTCGLYHLPYFTTESGDMPPILYAALPEIEAIRTE